MKPTELVPARTICDDITPRCSKSNAHKGKLFVELDRDALSVIMQWLPAADLCRLRQTCKRLNTIVTEQNNRWLTEYRSFCERHNVDFGEDYSTMSPMHCYLLASYRRSRRRVKTRFRWLQREIELAPLYIQLAHDYVAQVQDDIDVLKQEIKRRRMRKLHRRTRWGSKGVTFCRKERCPTAETASAYSLVDDYIRLNQSNEMMLEQLSLELQQSEYKLAEANAHLERMHQRHINLTEELNRLHSRFDGNNVFRGIRKDRTHKSKSTFSAK